MEFAKEHLRAGALVSLEVVDRSRSRRRRQVRALQGDNLQYQCEWDVLTGNWGA